LVLCLRAEDARDEEAERYIRAGLNINAPMQRITIMALC
jgi:hypothetical protein